MTIPYGPTPEQVGFLLRFAEIWSNKVILVDYHALPYGRSDKKGLTCQTSTSRRMRLSTT